MEQGVFIDVILAALFAVFGIMGRRFWQLIDQLRGEDRVLHDRITKVQTGYVQKADFDTAVDRILNRIDKMEEKLLHKE